MLTTQDSAVPSAILLEEVYQEYQTYEFKKGCLILLYQNNIWVVCRGIVRLSTFDSDGDEVSLGFVFQDMPFGLPLTHVNPYDATGLTDVVLMRVHEQEIEQSPLLAQRMQFQLNRRQQQVATLMTLVNQHPVSRRLQKLLLLLAREVGEQTLDGLRINVRLTHQQLTDFTGITRVTCTRILGLLQKRGWLSLDQTHHFILHESSVVDLR